MTTINEMNEVRELSANELDAVSGGTTFSFGGATFAFGDGLFAVKGANGDSVSMSPEGMSWKIGGKKGGVDYKKPQ